jgi:hypothetical protein
VEKCIKIFVKAGELLAWRTKSTSHLLKQDVAAWNAWRKENPDTRPDLRKADLSGEDLREANLSDD